MLENGWIKELNNVDRLRKKAKGETSNDRNCSNIGVGNIIIEENSLPIMCPKIDV